MTLARTLFLAGGLLLAAPLTMTSTPVRAEDAKPAAAAAATDPARVAAAKELLAAFGGVEQAKASIPQFVMALIAEIKDRDEKIAGPAEYFLRSETEPGKPRVTAYLAEVEKTAVDFYASHFTVDEMKAIIAFQTSPAGRKFQTETPQLMGQLSPLMARFQQGLIQDMQKGLTAGAAKDAAAGDKK